MGEARTFALVRASRRVAAVVAVGLLAVAGGCASVPRPDEAVARAEAMVRGAEQAGATQAAPATLRRAQDELQRARNAMRDEEYVEARRAAERAQVQAELAAAETRRAKTQQALLELERTVDVLEEEIQR
jgi:hypothetical protein